MLKKNLALGWFKNNSMFVFRGVDTNRIDPKNAKITHPYSIIEVRAPHPLWQIRGTPHLKISFLMLMLTVATFVLLFVSLIAVFCQTVTLCNCTPIPWEIALLAFTHWWSSYTTFHPFSQNVVYTAKVEFIIESDIMCLYSYSSS